MIRLLPFLLLLLSSFCSAQSSFWETDIGPPGGNVTVYPTANSMVYAYHHDNQYFRSADYGEHWAPHTVTKAVPNTSEERLEIGRTGVFYKVSRVQVGAGWVWRLYRSVDEGATWELRKNPSPVEQVWETPSGAIIGYDGSNRLHRSTDGGLTWQQTGVLGFLPSIPNTTVLFGENGSVVLAVENNPIQYSLNDGQTWTAGGTWNTSWYDQLAISASGALIRYRVHQLSDTLLWRSTDWGESWQAINAGFAPGENPSALTRLPSGRILLSTSSRIYFSDDDGLNWAMLASGGETPDRLALSTPLPNGDLLGFTKNALYRSTNEGLGWTFSTWGMQKAQVFHLALLSDSAYLAASPNGLWRTADGGTSWTHLLNDTTIQETYFDFSLAVVNADSFAFAMYTQLWRTTDGGQSFTEITPPGGISTFDKNIFAAAGGLLFAHTDVGVVRSPDFGQNWHAVTAFSYMNRLRKAPDGALYAFVESSAWKRSTDGGQNWQDFNIPGLTFLLGSNPDIVFDNSGTLYLNGYVGEQTVLARTVDLGLSGQMEGIHDSYAFGAMARNNLGHIYLHGESTVLGTVDEGSSWYGLPPLKSYSGNYTRVLEFLPSGKLVALGIDGNLYRSAQSITNGGYIRGAIRRDADAECSTPDAQEPLKNWALEVNGAQQYTLSTSASGQYAVFVDTGAYEVRARAPQRLWWSLCDSLQQVQVDSLQTVDSVDFVGVALSECPLMTVDVAIPRLRRCFDNPVYVHYCNSGSEPADSARVDLELDPYLSIVSADLPYTDLGNNTYRFQIGDVAPGDCGQFSLIVYVNCDSTVLGQTHCITAYGFPDTLCSPVPGWSGATIEAAAECQDTLVRLRLRNTGTDASNVLHFIIIEDDVVLFQGQNQYDVNEEIVMEYNANGRTWRIESQQEPNHPFSNLALAFLEGCGGFQSLGYINRFSVNGWTPSIDRACEENIGSYDPNDKQGFPLGYGDEGRIRPGQELEYLIRFQNTGTDTAFTVVIRDTLSAWLDAGSVRPGASSHAYTWSLSGEGVLIFRFDNILLPDSNTNLAGSQGFVSFKVQQRAEVPLETQLFNAAAIYFDFNAPIITNTTRHTVGIDYITGALDPAQIEERPGILVQPNPAERETLLQLPEGTVRVTLFDVRGLPLRALGVREQTLGLQRDGLPAGLYFLRAEDRQGRVVGWGKVVWK